MQKRYANLKYQGQTADEGNTTLQTTQLHDNAHLHGGLIDIQGASISYDEKVILKDIDVHVGKGELVYIIGRVGSGKSTLLKAIYAENEFDEGQATVLDFDLCRLKRRHIPELRRKMGIVFQDYSLLHTHTVFQNLDFVLRATGWEKKAIRKERIFEVLQQVGLEDRTNSYPHELSGGEQQRIAIARALLNNPQLILADEPTGNLDATTARGIIELLQSLTFKGTSVVLITHNMSHLKHFPGRIYECSEQTIKELQHSVADNKK